MTELDLAPINERLEAVQRLIGPPCAGIALTGYTVSTVTSCAVNSPGRTSCAGARPICPATPTSYLKSRTEKHNDHI